MKFIEKNKIKIYYDIDFNETIKNTELGNHCENWPVTYILYNRSKRKAYVGETTGFKTRMGNHLSDPAKKDYNKALFIDYSQATKSTILHLEAFLIRGLSISHELLSDLSNIKENSNKHSYYNEKKDNSMCEDVWDVLKDVGFVTISYKEMINKNEYKYSPYILLNNNQNEQLNNIIDELCNKKNNMIVIEGASGTGKSALAIQLFKKITDYSNFNEIIDDSMIGEDFERLYKIKKRFSNQSKRYSVAYVAPMNNFCTIIRKSIKNLRGLRKKDLKEKKSYINDDDLELIRVYSGANLHHLLNYIKKDEPLFDLIIVDEAQRLNRRYNLTNGNSYVAFDDMNNAFGLPCNKNRDDGNQLDWILKLSRNQIFFYDKRQTIRSSDIPSSYFEKIFKNATYRNRLTVEERCHGGVEYIDYVDSIFSSYPPQKKKTFSNYEFQIYDNYTDMINDLNSKEDALSLMASGYFFDSSDGKFDVEIEGMGQKWNQKNQNWVNSKKEKNEIGCIHVLEGVDTDYLGVIVGDEINCKDDKIDVDEDSYKDKVGKKCLDNHEQLIQFITNVYYILLTRAMKGTYLYVRNPKMKDYLLKYINRK